MKKGKLKIILWFITSLLVLNACNLPGSPTTSDAEAVYTQAAQTIAAQITQQAYTTLVAEVTRIASTPGATPFTLPTQTPPSLPPSVTPFLPTATAVPPTSTPPPPTATPIVIPCNQAQFIKDVTVPDGSIFTPGSEFTKVWRLKNIGSCTWDEDYSLVFVDGDRMQALKVIPLQDTIRPGEKIDLTADFITPSQPGRYRSFWMLSNASDKRFGIGDDAKQAFWAEIKVVAPNQNFAFDLAANFCLASWDSSAGDLLCPGDPESADGSIVLLERPVLENGRREDESTLWMRPEATRDGWISGVFPTYKVKQNDHFLADIGCLKDNKGCDVLFSLDYRVSGGSKKNLGQWEETYDGVIRRIDIDLSALADKKVQFILGVTNQGKASVANAFWLAPSIRQGSPSTEPDASGPAVEAARKRVANDLGLDYKTLTVQSVEPAEWRDSCLGVHLPDQVCAEVIIPGYRIILSTTDNQYEAHTNTDGSIVFWFES